MGEEGDKGLGMGFGKAKGLHFDDAEAGPLLDRCADLGIPVNIHVADPIWMYQKMDETNDGMMNARRLEARRQAGHRRPLRHDRDVLERTVRRHPRTTFVACHLANLDYDLARLGRLLDRRPNLYADISARYAETAVIPRFAARFFKKYPDRSSTARTWAPTRTCTDHVPHPGDARRALLRADLRVPLELLRLRRSRTRCCEKLYRANALAVAKRAAANGRRRGTRRSGAGAVMRDVRVASVQMESAAGDKEANFRKVERLARGGGRAGAPRSSSSPSAASPATGSCAA